MKNETVSQPPEAHQVFQILDVIESMRAEGHVPDDAQPMRLEMLREYTQSLCMMSPDLMAAVGERLHTIHRTTDIVPFGWPLIAKACRLGSLELACDITLLLYACAQTTTDRNAIFDCYLNIIERAAILDISLPFRLSRLACDNCTEDAHRTLSAKKALSLIPKAINAGHLKLAFDAIRNTFSQMLGPEVERLAVEEAVGVFDCALSARELGLAINVADWAHEHSGSGMEEAVRKRCELLDGVLQREYHPELTTSVPAWAQQCFAAAADIEEARSGLVRTTAGLLGEGLRGSGAEKWHLRHLPGLASRDNPPQPASTTTALGVP